ncbi:unnamed protein product [Ectocarpus sp. CCAP 1310/34]|nr:unnamed protein product [Ectocarpus sp. CCAP 1310/34]
MLIPLLDEKASIIRLLRIFLGAAVGDEDHENTPLSAPPSLPDSTSAPPLPATSPKAPPRAESPLTGKPDPCLPGGDRLERNSPKLLGQPRKPQRTAESETDMASVPDAREQAGCALWDMSADEGNAFAMCSAGLVAVSCAVLRQCASAIVSAAAEARAGGLSSSKSLAPVEAKEAAMAVAPPLPDREEQVERLREVTCGLLANVFSHRSLRQQIAGDLALGQELLGAFHSTDDPACLTELLRLFSTAALIKSTESAYATKAMNEDNGDAQVAGSTNDPVGDGRAATTALPETNLSGDIHGEGQTAAGALRMVAGAAGAAEAALGAVEISSKPAAGENRTAVTLVTRERNEAEATAVPASEPNTAGAALAMAAWGSAGLASGIAAEETLERLAFFLQNSLEERLLAWACSLTYSLMYRHGDAVIRPLIEVFGLEESLCSLLQSRSGDLAYEKLGGTETGFDALLRCLEVLTTSEVSGVGPPSSPAAAEPPVVVDPPALAQDSGELSPKQQLNEQPRKRRNLAEESTEEGPTNGGGDCEAACEVQPETSKTRPSLSRGEMRGRVIRGLVSALTPWEHSRHSQRAALLVLGNILENAIEEDAGAVGGVKSPEGARRASESCAVELDRGLAALAAGGTGEWAEDDERDPAAAVRRVGKSRREFVESVHNLVHSDDPVTAANEEDGLGEDLLEAVEAIRKILEESGDGGGG